MQVPVPFSELAHADLVVEREYLGGTAGTSADDPLAVLLPVGNQGGFRYKGSVSKQNVKLLVLYTSGAEPDWPDTIDPETGDFTYYGDNRHPGSELHDTQRRGNQLLSDVFAWSRLGPDDRARVPVILLFEKAAPGRTVRFRGLLVPGSPRLTAEEELVAVWRTTRDRRFQNYRAHFTILDVPVVPREWISAILRADPLGPSCPRPWRRWVKARIFDALEAPKTIAIPNKEAQYPPQQSMELLRAIHQHFEARPVGFEHFAADLWLHSDLHVESVDVTRPSRDGGRDAVGTYLIGPSTDPIRIHFALEAKCLRPGGGGVNVKMISRLVSRLKHRNFGVLVTTAHIGTQPYREVREDNHPVVFVTGRDLVEYLRSMGISRVPDLLDYLRTKYPVDHESDMAQIEAQARGADLALEISHVTDREAEVSLHTEARSQHT